MKQLGKYSMGIGDRFGHQGSAQLKAITKAAEKGVEITPVWNKSNREHMIIGTKPEDTRVEADRVVKNAHYEKPYFVDADHINLDTVSGFIDCSDFFTIDVSSYIGRKAEKHDTNEFIESAHKYTGNQKIPGNKLSYDVTVEMVTAVTEKYLYAAIKAFEIYRKIEKIKGKGNFVTEISMDEVHDPQSPVELFFILKMLALENIPAQTIAPRFPGRFNKGVDYDGDPQKFAAEFEADLQIIDYAIEEFGLPVDLKMSIHSGSDKFSIYPLIGNLIKKHNKGIHLKTAGTTWLEEVIGLSMSEGEGLEFVKEVYRQSLGRIDELCAPYSDVIDIKTSYLPSSAEISTWDGKRFADAIRHNPDNKNYNRNMRQLLHVAYKLAAERIDQFNDLLQENEEIISECVSENLYDRHIVRLFDL
jgi:hypothetical protein